MLNTLNPDIASLDNDTLTAILLDAVSRSFEYRNSFFIILIISNVSSHIIPSRNEIALFLLTAQLAYLTRTLKVPVAASSDRLVCR